MLILLSLVMMDAEILFNILYNVCMFCVYDQYYLVKM